MIELTSPLSVTAPAITTRLQLEALVENIADLRRERDELRRAQEAELESVRQRQRAPLAEIDRLIDIETSWAEAWARQNPDALGPDRTITCAHATLGYRLMRPWIDRASRRWNWTRIAETLAGLDWGKRYLRTPPVEVDKEAIVADLPHLSLIDLRNAGIRVDQGERFFIALNETDSMWQQAA